MSGPFRIVAAGDSAVIVEFEERIDPDINARAVALAGLIRTSGLQGLRDVVPSYRSVAVYFDPLRTDYDRLHSLLEGGANSPTTVEVRGSEPIQIPVRYGGEEGPDLSYIASRAGLSEDEVADIHCATTYRVYMLGFLPGFAYMGIVDPRIAAPRLAAPRVRVRAGSVGLAGQQTGIYPIDSPGGWLLVGRSLLEPYDLSRRDPFLFQAGDLVRFLRVA
jgi:KipI family sensor histidine kinase inhibitor